MVDPAAAAKFAILRRIYDLAREQRDALELDHVERFQRLMEQREELLTHLMDTAEALPENIIVFPGMEASVDDVLALDTVIRGILERDRHNEALLAAKMDAVRRDLTAVNAGSRAAGGYRVAASTASMVDRRS